MQLGNELLHTASDSAHADILSAAGLKDELQLGSSVSAGCL